MVELDPLLLERELVLLRWRRRLSRSLLELLLPFVLCGGVVGAVWWLLRP
jgi:hypothetical protein